MSIFASARTLSLRGSSEENFVAVNDNNSALPVAALDILDYSSIGVELKKQIHPVFDFWWRIGRNNLILWGISFDDE